MKQFLQSMPRVFGRSFAHGRSFGNAANADNLIPMSFPVLAQYLPRNLPNLWNQNQLYRLKHAPLDTSLLPKRVEIVEVGPRDGLQSSKYELSVDQRVGLIKALSLTGLSNIELGALVSYKAVPKMAGSLEVFQSLRQANVTASLHMLVPNAKKMEEAVAAGVKIVSVFVSVAEDFSQRNTKRSVADGLKEAAEVCRIAKENNIRARGYVSCIFRSTDPNEIITPDKVLHVATELFNMGCYEVSLGDTLGSSTPILTHDLLVKFPFEIRRFIALHLHDTNGRASESFIAAMQMGVNKFDGSIAGLGGCPYALGSAGNIDTFKMVYLCHVLGIETDVSLNRIEKVDRWLKGLLASKERELLTNKEQVNR